MKIASIDIGSNSVILLIAEVLAYHQKISPLLNKYSTPRLGKNLSFGQDFDQLAILRLKEVLKNYIDMAKAYDCELILPAATQAFRKARNANIVVKQIQKDLGVNIRILSGIEEGILTFYGATAQLENFSGYMIDIGGGSTEIFLGFPGELNHSCSYPFGAVSLCDRYDAVPPCGNDKIEKIKKAVLDAIRNEVPIPIHNLRAVAVAGTPTTLACMQLGSKDFDEKLIEGHNLSLQVIKDLIITMSTMTPAEILESFGAVVAGREDVILTGAVILETIMELLNLKHVYVSTHGLRHGIIYNHMRNLI